MCFIIVSQCYLSANKLPNRKPRARKTKVGKEVKEVMEPSIKRAEFSTTVEENISTNSDDFLDADIDLQ